MNISELRYKVEYIGNTKEDLSEKQFCFACGCFQGNPPVQPT